MSLDTALKNSQVEIVDQEIFSLLVKEAGNLPTASAQVSERLIIINAAQGLDLTFELVECCALVEIPGNLTRSSQGGQHRCLSIHNLQLDERRERMRANLPRTARLASQKTYSYCREEEPCQRCGAPTSHRHSAVSSLLRKNRTGATQSR